MKVSKFASSLCVSMPKNEVFWLPSKTHLNDFDVLITYNGKSYDQPLLETRYLMNRHKSPFARLGHLDLLHGARRLWKLRLASCRLMQLEEQILGVLRDGDLPGELIPYVYFEYLRSHEARRLVPIFHHNAMDILDPRLFNGHCADRLSHYGFGVIGASRGEAGRRFGRYRSLADRSGGL